jgi:hypothetical protein
MKTAGDVLDYVSRNILSGHHHPRLFAGGGGYIAVALACFRPRGHTRQAARRISIPSSSGFAGRNGAVDVVLIQILRFVASASSTLNLGVGDPIK